MNDKEIVDRILRHHDVNSYSLIVGRYTPMVLSKALAIVKDRELAGEIVQQTFVRAYDRLDTFRGETLGPWITAIACRQAINHLDEARRRQTRQKECAMQQPEEYDEEHEQLLQRLEHAIDELPEKDRQIIQLHYYEKMKTETIAAKTGLSQQNILVKLHRIRLRLKEKIKTYGN